MKKHLYCARRARCLHALRACWPPSLSLVSQNARREQVGPLPGGGFLLNTGWKIQPAGKQLPSTRSPCPASCAPDGRYLLVLNGGYKPPSISVIDIQDMKETSRVPVADAWLGLTFSPKGRLRLRRRRFPGDGLRVRLLQGTLVPARQFPIVDRSQTHQQGLHRRRGILARTGT